MLPHCHQDCLQLSSLMIYELITVLAIKLICLVVIMKVINKIQLCRLIYYS